MTCQLGRTEVWLVLAASGEGMALESGWLWSGWCSCLDADGEAQAWGHCLQIAHCTCPVICDAELFCPFFFIIKKKKKPF